MYSPIVLDHLDNPRNGGAMPDATVCGTATNPVCGDLLHLYLKLDGALIGSASFEAQACPPCIAAGSLLTELVTGQTVAHCQGFTKTTISEALGYLPPNKQHCAILALDALRAALAQIS